MSSGSRLREAGQRKSQRTKSHSLLSATTSSHPENRINLQQVYAIEHLYQSSPAIQAARTVLVGQLLSGGISLRKEGKDVELTEQFKQHLNEVWIPFAGDVVDCFLKWGFAPIVYEEHVDDVLHASLLYNKRQKKQASESPSSKRLSKAAAEALKKEQEAKQVSPVIVPHVPVLGSYEVAYRLGGRLGYKREYLLYSNEVSNAAREDDEARVVVRQHPDATGNVNSPVASVFELGSFISALNELALTAESSRARPHITTQMRKKESNSLDPGNLFFDSESRAVQANVDSGEGAAAARALQLQQQLCDTINKLQTTSRPADHQHHSFGGQASYVSGAYYAPPEVQPQLFTLPKEQELCPNVQHPESRGDLEGLTRMCIEQFSAALGVPSDLIFSGRFAGKSTSQLSLLNITVSQLAKSVNAVLTICYRDIYSQGPDDAVGQLNLLTSPLSSTDEVLNLFNGGLVPIEIAVPSVLHALGATKDEIDSAVEKAVSDREKKEKDEEMEKKIKSDTHDVTMEEKRLNMKLAEKDANAPAAAATDDKKEVSSVN